jgi:hypothetical protein
MLLSPPSYRLFLADALLAEVDDAGRRVLGHQAGTGQDRLAATRGEQEELEERQEDDRQVALEVLLLVDREQRLPAGDVLEQRGGEIEAAELDRAQLVDALERLDGGDRAGGAEGEDAVVVVALDSGADLLLSVCGVAVPPLEASRPALKPWKRCSRAVLPCSWLTQRPFMTPALPSAVPPARPAISSVWPTWVRMPNFWNTSAPELIDTTGMPAETAAVIDFWSALASGIDTIRPSGLRATWVSISWLIATMSNFVGAS